MNDKTPADGAGIPARGAVELERDRIEKLGLCAAVIVAIVVACRILYKPLLGAAAAVYLLTRPSIKDALSQLTEWLSNARK